MSTRKILIHVQFSFNPQLKKKKFTVQSRVLVSQIVMMRILLDTGICPAFFSEFNAIFSPLKRQRQSLKSPWVSTWSWLQESCRHTGAIGFSRQRFLHLSGFSTYFYSFLKTKKPHNLISTQTSLFWSKQFELWRQQRSLDPFPRYPSGTCRQTGVNPCPHSRTLAVSFSTSLLPTQPPTHM